MLFNSWQFAIFLPCVLAVYYCLATRAQNLFLLAASYYFYGSWDWRFLILLALSTVMDYAGAIGIERATAANSARGRKAFLWLAIGFNLSLLGFFKYFNFFVDSFTRLAATVHWHPSLPVLRVVLPVGISFYTFQSMAYTIDVYRGRARAERDFPLYALYVSFFPQLVAGPIERAPHLLHQLREPKVVDAEKVSQGLTLIVIGLFKKMAIADAVSPRVDATFAAAHTAPALMLLQGVWLFAIQIYCDFSGYTDIARGVAKLLGVDLMENFNQPYLSRDVTEFWRRWHISLSSWLRDYLYIPLGGNRSGTLATYRNLFLTMLLGGLWHGASWTFVAWGALNGFYLAAHKFILSRGRPIRPGPTLLPTAADAIPDDTDAIRQPQGPATRPRRTETNRPWVWPTDLFKMAGTFGLILLTWVFFRAANIHQAAAYLHGIASLRGGLHGLGDAAMPILWFGGLVFLLDLPQYVTRRHAVLLDAPWPVRGMAVAAMLLLVMLLSPNHETPFIYFQF